MKIKYSYSPESHCIYCNASIANVFTYKCGTPVATVIKNPNSWGYMTDGVLPIPSECCAKRSFKKDVEEALKSIEKENSNICAMEPIASEYIPKKPWWRKLFNF